MEKNVQKKQLIQLLMLSFIISFISCDHTKEIKEPVNDRVHIFYYNWYGNPEQDREYFHWNHDILPHWSDTTWDNAGSFLGGSDIGANFYPELGCYSSNDSSIIAKHMELIKEAGIGVFAITWWGKDSYEDSLILMYLDIAYRYELKLAFHIEPFYKTAVEFKEQLKYLFSKYGKHPALYRFKDKPFYYIYDSYKLSTDEWQKILMPDRELSVRNTYLDATFIGLWVEEKDGKLIVNSGFNGFYTYFASDGFVYGSTTSNWPYLSEFAKQNHLIFIPCVGPGYIDTRIRPWNAINEKKRNKGKYYKKMFSSALRLNPDFMGITSFNEWHEGTQIEPAIHKSIPSYDYEDYGKDIEPMFYINQTKELINAYKK